MTTHVMPTEISPGNETTPALSPAAAKLRARTALNPAQYESEKTHQQKAEDVIYTLNHAITCLGITDIFVLAGIANTWKAVSGHLPSWAHSHGDGGYSPVQWLVDHASGKWKNKSANPEDYRPKTDDHHHHDHDHGHDHAHDHVHDHHDHDHGKPKIELTPHSSGKDVRKKAWHNMSGWIIGEAIGDLGAVPLTIVTQRVFPGFMNAVRHMLEPAIGKTFRKNTHEAAVNWGKARHLSADSQEVADRAQELYQYEMGHMPQMAVWTVLSIALNFGVVAGINKWGPKEYHHGMRDLMMEKLLGATITGGMVVGLRGLTPNGAHWWDQNVGKHVVLPVSKLFGVNTSDAEAFAKKREMLEEPATKVSAVEPKGRTQETPEIAVAV